MLGYLKARLMQQTLHALHDCKSPVSKLTQKRQTSFIESKAELVATIKKLKEPDGLHHKGRKGEWLDLHVGSRLHGTGRVVREAPVT